MIFEDGYTTKDIRFDWLKSDSEPVTISSKLEMPNFMLTWHDNVVCERQTSTGKYFKIFFFL